MRDIVHTTHALVLTDSGRQLPSVAASDGRLATLEDLQLEHSEALPGRLP